MGCFSSLGQDEGIPPTYLEPARLHDRYPGEGTILEAKSM